MKKRYISVLFVWLALSAASTANAAIVNPSFEGDLTGWDFFQTSSTYGASGIDQHFTTDGTYNGRIHTFHATSISAGSFATLSQSIDFSNIESIIFDVMLEATTNFGSWSNSFVGSVSIGGTQIWSSSLEGTYLDIFNDVSSITGVQTLQFKFTSLANQTVDSQWFLFDNITYVEAVSAVPVPATVWLFSSGLIGLIGVARRKKTIAE